MDIKAVRNELNLYSVIVLFAWERKRCPIQACHGETPPHDLNMLKFPLINSVGKMVQLKTSLTYSPPDVTKNVIFL